MGYQKIALLLQALYEKTKKGELNWEITDERDVFQVSFSEYSIRIDMDLIADGDDVYSMFIYNSEGSLIENANNLSLTDILKSKSYKYFSELYGIARRQAMGVEKALDDILNELGCKKTDEFVQTNDNDDLPF